MIPILAAIVVRMPLGEVARTPKGRGLERNFLGLHALRPSANIDIVRKLHRDVTRLQLWLVEVELLVENSSAPRRGGESPCVGGRK